MISVAVVITAYNSEKYLAKAIKSALSQSYKDLKEIIVIDDGSTDSTAEIASSYKEVKLVQQKNQGPSSARNLGIKESSSDLISFLDADDYWHKDKIAKQVELFKKNTELGFCLTFMKVFSDSDSLDEKHKKQVGKVEPCPLPSSLMVKRKVFNEIGLFDLALNQSEDTDWLLRAIDSGIELAHVKEPLVYRRLHEENLSYEDSNELKSFLKVLKRSIDRKRG